MLPVDGQWEIVQSNGFRVFLNLHQDGGNITGTARTSSASSNNVTGTVDDHSIHLRIPEDRSAITAAN